jgi:hypothetical protein
MNNIFEISKILNTDDIKIKYKYIQTQLILKCKLMKDITILDSTYNTKLLLHHINNLEYLIFATIKQNGGFGEYMSILSGDTPIDDNTQELLYNKLFDMVLIDKNIDNPLCNCCLNEYNQDGDVVWYTTRNTHKEYYTDDKQYISYNYIHICNSCNEFLKIKIKKYYKSLQLIPFSVDVFNEQSVVFIKYQTLLFNLLFNYNVGEIRDVFI